jgi:uncharacterized protein YlxP (DUF503 family)
MGKQGTAHIGVLTAEFFIPAAVSLKDKRSVLKGMRDRVRNEFNVSAAEIDYRDKWQRSQWVFCSVGPDRAYVDAAIQKLLSFLRSGRHASLADYHIEFL